MTTRSGLKALAAATTLATALVLAPPAHAEVLRVDDGADATPSLNDIRVVRVGHGEQNVKVRVTFPNLKKKADAGLSVFLDTRAGRRGPEYGVGLPLFSGGDYVLLRMRKWKFVGDPIECSYGGKFAWRKDFVRLRFERACFNEPDRVRVGMRMRDDHDASHPIIDWLIGRRKWTEWLTSGPTA